MLVGLASQLRAQMGTRTERMLTAARLAALAGLLWASAHQVPPRGVALTTRRSGCSWLAQRSAGWAGWPAAGSGARGGQRGASSHYSLHQVGPSPPLPLSLSSSWPWQGSVAGSLSKGSQRLQRVLSGLWRLRGPRLPWALLV